MKSIDYVISRTAQDLGQPEEKVRAVIMEYWQTSLNRLINLNATTVTLRHIGNFTISKYKLNNYIRKRIKIIKRINNSDIAEDVKLDKLQFHYERLNKALYHRNILAEHYAKMFGNI